MQQQALVLSQEDVAKLRLLDRPDQREAARAQLEEELVGPMIDALLRIVQQTPDAAKAGVKIEITLQTVPKDRRPKLTTAEVAAQHRVSQQQVRRWCEQGLIPAVRTPGGTWRILQPDIVCPLITTKSRRKRVDGVAGRWQGRREELAQYRGADEAGPGGDDDR